MVSSLPTLMSDLLRSGMYSDLVISCKGATFRVHRAIEAIDSRVGLPEDHISTIKGIIWFLYFNDYSDGNMPGFQYEAGGLFPIDFVHSASSDSSPSDGGSEALHKMRNNLDVSMAADKFGILSLRDTASSRLIQRIISSDFDTLAREIDEIWMTNLSFRSEIQHALIDATANSLRQYLDRHLDFFGWRPDISRVVLRRMAGEDDPSIYTDIESNDAEEHVVNPSPYWNSESNTRQPFPHHRRMTVQFTGPKKSPL